MPVAIRRFIYFTWRTLQAQPRHAIILISLSLIQLRTISISNRPHGTVVCVSFAHWRTPTGTRAMTHFAILDVRRSVPDMVPHTRQRRIYRNCQTSRKRLDNAFVGAWRSALARRTYTMGARNPTIHTRATRVGAA